MNVIEIARVAHEVNRAYCEALGDHSQVAWEDAPQWQRDSAILGVDLHIGNPNAGAQASHESWSAQKVADGWVYGSEKRPDLKQHPCLVPFNELPVQQQAKDFIFRGVVIALSRHVDKWENADTKVIETALRLAYIKLDELLVGCLDVDGKIKAPDKSIVMKARAMLPSYCSMSLSKNSLHNF